MSKSETQGDVWLEAVHEAELVRPPLREEGGSFSSGMLQKKCCYALRARQRERAQYLAEG